MKAEIRNYRMWFGFSVEPGEVVELEWKPELRKTRPNIKNRPSALLNEDDYVLLITNEDFDNLLFMCNEYYG